MSLPSPLTAPVVPTIAHLENKKYPQFQFEWHLVSKRVYVIDIPGVWEKGVFHPDPTKGTVTAKYIGIDCESPAQFKSIVGGFFIGYQASKNERTNSNGSL